MTRLVKLTRERWEMLCASNKPIEPKAATEIRNWQNQRAITITVPTEVDGVTFLPAEYVPGGIDRPKRAFKLSPPPCA